MKNITLLTTSVVLLFLSQTIFSQTFNYSDSNVKGVLSYLASDGLKGRGATSEQDLLTADFIAKTLENYGFKPVIGEDPKVPFYLSLYRESGAGSKFSINNKESKEGIDFKVHPSSPELDGAGKYKLLADSLSGFSGSAVVVSISYDSIPYIVNKLRAKGASAVIAYTGVNLNEQRRGSTRPLGLPVILVSETLRNNLVNKKSGAIGYKTVINLVKAPSYNVIMKYGPENPKMRIMVGAHHDHLGERDVKNPETGVIEKKIYNGADDNASGVAAALEIGRMLSQYAESMNVEIIVSTFGAEERGLVGSRALADTLKKLSMLPHLMVNLDMVGRLNENKLEVGGIGTFASAEDVVNRLNLTAKFDLKIVRGGGGASDHSSFFRAGVPILYFNTGIHKQYHKPEDELHLINFDGIERISLYISKIINEIVKSEVPELIRPETR